MLAQDFPQANMQSYEGRKKEGIRKKVSTSQNTNNKVWGDTNSRHLIIITPIVVAIQNVQHESDCWGSK